MKDILLMGTYSGGFNLYEFNYTCEEGAAEIRYIGELENEMLEVMPEAIREVNGYLQVDYNQLQF